MTSKKFLLRMAWSCIPDCIRALRRGHWGVVRLETRTFFPLLRELLE